MKKIAVGALGEFWYGDYKEPFQQLEGGVPGHPQGVILKDDEGKLMCAFCGGTYHQLGSHAAHKHGLKAAEYKAEVGLMNSSALVSEKVRLRMVAHGVRRQANGELRRAAPPSTRGLKLPSPWNTEEALNKTGRCYAQVIAVAQTIEREHGRITSRRLADHGINWPTLRRYFETVDELAKAAGGTSVGPRTDWSDTELKTALRSLAMRLGRTPSRSDIRRYGLPGATTYVRRWGSYAKACQAAGLDANLPSPGTASPFDQVAILTAYATTGSSDTAGRSLGISSSAVLNALHRYGFPFPPFYKGPGRKEWAAEMARRLAGTSEKVA